MFLHCVPLGWSNKTNGNRSTEGCWRKQKLSLQPETDCSLYKVYTDWRRYPFQMNLFPESNHRCMGCYKTSVITWTEHGCLVADRE